MSKTALVLGASGQVGTAVIPALLRDGWTVRAGARGAHPWPDGVEGIHVDRADLTSFTSALGTGVDLLVDLIAYTDTHARQIVTAAGHIGSAVVLSTISVYADEAGHTLDEASGVNDFPAIPRPITESQCRTAPSVATYSTRKVMMEDVLLADDSPVATTVLRPGAIYGPGSVHPRELWFIKRALDRRPVQLLNWGGRSRFHRSDSANIAELVRLAAEHPARRALNAVDDDALTTREIGTIINRHLDHHPDEVLIAEASPLGDTPWSVPLPFEADMSAARRHLGYRSVARFDDSAPALIDSIVNELGTRDWRDAFPAFLRANGEAAFDYAAEDAFVRSLTREG
jgi:nucleoside-diphosphate-sugar epimerase